MQLSILRVYKINGPGRKCVERFMDLSREDNDARDVILGTPDSFPENPRISLEQSGATVPNKTSATPGDAVWIGNKHTDNVFSCSVNGHALAYTGHRLPPVKWLAHAPELPLRRLLE